MDHTFNALIRPTNLVFVLARWSPAKWRIQSISTGHYNVYDAMAWVDTNQRLIDEAVAHYRRQDATTACCIMHTRFEVIEEL